MGTNPQGGQRRGSKRTFGSQAKNFAKNNPEIVYGAVGGFGGLAAALGINSLTREDEE